MFKIFSVIEDGGEMFTFNLAVAILLTVNRYYETRARDVINGSDRA